jgi:hypothetical protein
MKPWPAAFRRLKTPGQAAVQQPMFQELSNPFAILDIGLASRHLLDVGRVDQPHLKVAFEQVEDGLPIDACALHGDDRTTLILQPVAQRQQVSRHRAKGTHFLLAPSLRIAANQTHLHVFLVHIHARAQRIQDFHGSPLQRPHGAWHSRAAEHLLWSQFSFACSPNEGDSQWC